LNETYGYINAAVNETEIIGCPSVQKWCYYIPAMTITQFLLGYAFTAVGYPIAVTLIQTIFSKILGPRPQVSNLR
jgi:ceroid-lipofuscinosis MFS transporter 7